MSGSGDVHEEPELKPEILAPQKVALPTPRILPADVEMAVVFADEIERHPSKRSVKIDQRRTDHEVNVEGAIAEIVFFRCFGQDWKPKVYDGGDPGHDLVVSEFQIQVKATRYKEGRLLVGPKKLLPHVEILALVIVNESLMECTLAGWVMRKRWDKEHGVGDFGYGPRDFLEQPYLSALRDLYKVLEMCEKEKGKT